MNETLELEKLINTLEVSTAPCLGVEEAKRQLSEAGFYELNLSAPWDLRIGEGYYVPVYGTTLFAFRLGSEPTSQQIRVLAAHTDHPCLKIKPNSEIVDCNYLKLNIEVYGGPILNSWLDRPLSIAGHVTIRSSDIMNPERRIVDIKDSIATIPNLAIHMNRDVNKGVELNKQTHMLPILGMLQDNLNKNHFFIDYLSSYLNVKKDDILDFELQLYINESPKVIGLNKELLSSPRLDNITSMQACITGLINGIRDTGINMICLFDHEEVGSQTKQGADSALSHLIMEKIFQSLGSSRDEFLSSIFSGLFISLDVAHGYHPNYKEVYDITNHVYLNHGLAFKSASSQTYATDSEACAIIKQICNKYSIPYQISVNRSDIKGGSTLGSKASTWMNIRTVDMGTPVLGMHSARELMGIKDYISLLELMTHFFSNI